MITEDLFKTILVEPAKKGADMLFIIAGYASAALASHQLETLLKLEKYPKVQLIVGMCAQDGISQSNHLAFQALSSEDYLTTFECYYAVKLPPIHTKAYGWFKSNKPFCGFIGSANYTYKAFSKSQREAMSDGDAQQIKSYFDKLLKETIDCRDNKADALVKRYRESVRRKPVTEPLPEVSEVEDDRVRYMEYERVTISLLARGGEVGKSSGLNWGIRIGKPYKRDPNQAYIRVPSSIAKTKFFPPLRQHFTILTDDGKILICARAQEEIGKAIHSPLKNSQIGEYFRNRLGLASGAPVTKDHLLKYGRTDIDFYKIDDDEYYMDFSVSK